MTIASEITDLQTNLAAAKAAVTAKGGAVGNTGLAGLASEIANIPGGGGGYTPSQWGKVWFYPWKIDWQLENVTNCTDVTIDWTQFNAYLENWGNPLMTPNQIAFDYDPSTQYWISYNFFENPLEIDTQSLEASLGIAVTLEDDQQYAHFEYNKGLITDSQNGLNCIELRQYDWNNYVTNGVDSQNIYSARIFGDWEFPVENIVKFEMGSQPTSIPANFLNVCTNLTDFNMDYCTNVTTIGNNFLGSCTKLNSQINLPTSLTSIGASFLYNCRLMTSTVDVGSLSPSILGASTTQDFATYESTAPMYTTGITLTGANAQAWKTALPDSSSNPYRKLIVGS